MRPASIVDYLIEELGELKLPLNSLDDVSLEKFREDNSAGVRNAVIALVGVTGSGKTTLANKLFGAGAGAVMASADTTDQVALFELPSGLVIADTPGAGGPNERNENVTRAFLGLPQLTDVTQVTQVPMVHYVLNSGRAVGTPWLGDPPKPDLCLFLVDHEHGGFDRSVLNFYRAMREHPSLALILVVNKRGTLNVQQRFELSRNVTERAEAPILISAENGEGLLALVTECLRRLPGCAADSFNRQVEQEFRAGRAEVINGYLRLAAAAAAVARLDESGVGGLSRVQAIVVGASLRAALDMGVAEEVWASETTERIVELAADRLRTNTEISELTSPENGGGGADLSEYILALPRLVKLMGALALDPRVDASDKALLALTAAYVISPLDFIPDFIPVVGLVDDVFLAALTLLRLINRCGRDVVLELWDGKPEMLDFLTRDVPDLATRFLPEAVASRLRSYAHIDRIPAAALPAGGPPSVLVGGYLAVELLYRSTFVALAGIAEIQKSEEDMLRRLVDMEEEITAAAEKGDANEIVEVLGSVNIRF